MVIHWLRFLESQIVLRKLPMLQWQEQMQHMIIYQPISIILVFILFQKYAREALQVTHVL